MFTHNIWHLQRSENISTRSLQNISVAIIFLIIVGVILAYLLIKRKFCCQDSVVDDQFIELALPCERQSLERKNTPKVYDTEWIKTLKKKWR